MVIKVLETRLYRPNEINELEKPSLYSYYVEGGKAHLIRKERDKEEELSVLDNILDYQIISKDIVIVFTTFDELQIIQTKKPIIIEKITEVPNFYWPYNAHLIGDNKILFEFYWRSEQKNRMMIYYIEENLFVQSLDKVILSSLNDDKDYLLIVPNAFTPNNDLANESFKPITKGLKKIRLDIYDTWGSLIYSEKGDNLEGWDGKIKGEKADNGNYTYKVVGEKFDGINVEREGTFALVR
jgi:gliding motility-associated-like protein